MTDVGKHVVSAGSDDSVQELSRTNAVAAALEVITAYATSGTPINLSYQFEQLSKYADQIQDALKVR